MMENALLIFQRAAELGEVKSRIADKLGKEKALEIHRKLVTITHAKVQHQAYTTITYSTTAQEGVKKQAAGDLGQKMAQAMDHELNDFKKAVIIGVDCPAVDADLVLQAFTTLEDKDVVLGPALDGGYYLVGCRASFPELFQDIDWGTGRVLLQSLEHCRKHGRSVALLRPLRDVDTLEDYTFYEELKHYP